MSLTVESLSFLTEYLSVIVAILLGAIAYFQTKAINELEYARYSVFAGIEKLDFSLSAKGNFEKNDNSKGIVSLHELSPNAKSIFIFPNLCNDLPGHLPTKNLLIPFVFTTKNSPLIVAIDIRKISVEFMQNLDRVLRKKFRIKKNPLHTIIKDEGNFNICLDMTIPKEMSYSSIIVTLHLVLTDHHGRTHKILTQATIANKNGLLLTATQTP